MAIFSCLFDMAIRQELLLELSDVVGPENAEGMTESLCAYSLTTSYILSFQDGNDIKASLKDILGNESVANQIANDILKSRGQVRVLFLTVHTIAEYTGREDNCTETE